MIVGKKDNLEEVAALAAREKAAGNVYFDILVEPRRQVARFLQLWDGVVGRVVGRSYYEETVNGQRNVDMVEARSVQYFQVRVNAVSVIEAARRAAVRGELNRAAPLRANQIAPPIPPLTAR